ncbi:hypothetical protein BGW36DRAFT_355112 [Talaromyces proteolyticus]|uniref:Uncharacterized protein n=1 Tax=Talaromyces proteolyticus TaxID=1131652 RepID=A0AAD4L329_9EURO|nr:uncharacterized protein BGW36DRAFT_355112 [Talaromyces proteolyticus]KAH8703704.1 hypothetical protein BGW36DRAFT_355112 [Talaromyces proteolyticus]
MKFIYALALLAGSALALPASPPNSGQIVSDLGPEVQKTLTVTGTDAKELLVELSPEVAALVSGLGLPSVGVPLGSVVKTAANVGDLLKDISPEVKNILVVTGQDGSALLIELAPSVAALVGGLLLPPLAVPVGTIVTTLGDHVKRAEGTGQLLTDLGKHIDGALTIAGPETTTLLLQLSPELTALVSGLGLPPVGAIVGSVIASASSVGELLTKVGHGVDGLLVTVEHGGQFLLVSLSPVVAGLLSGLGLPALGVPVGTIVDTVAANL